MHVFLLAKENKEQNFEAMERSNAEDLEWLERFKAGNRRAFDFFVRKYQRRLYGVIYNMTSHKEDAADILQDVFIKIFRAIPKFKGDSQFYTWLYRIAVNTTITFLKKNKKSTSMSLEGWDESHDLSDIFLKDARAEKGDKTILLKELQEKLNEALQKLSNIHRTVVVLFEIEGMSHAEIAKILECSEGTVRSRLHYAKEELKRLLSNYLKDYGSDKN